MPAEAIHLTALDDTLVALPAALRAKLVDRHTLPATRLGAMFVDLPYFESVTATLVRHTLGLKPRPLPWGDLLHQQAPIALARRIGQRGVELRRSGLRSDGEYLIALALGYICHAAVDTALHPLVNRMAAERAAVLGDHPLRQHREVEKYHSVLFHEERHGRDCLGSAELQDFITLDVTPLWRPGPIAEAVTTALLECLGTAPSASAFRDWGRGLSRYVSVLSGPLGRRAVSAADKERERPAVYDAIDFPRRYAEAVARSISWVRTLAEHLDAAAEPSCFFAVIPEQSLDPPWQVRACP